MLPEIPAKETGKVARFLDDQGELELALDLATDPDHRFDLAIRLGKLDVAMDLARDGGPQSRFQTVGDAALKAWDIKRAEKCYRHADDFNSLLLLYSATSNTESLMWLK